MPGAMVQLNSRGEQDRWLNCKPKLFLFKTAFKRHGGFAFQTFEESFNVSSFGETSVCSLPRDVDLITNVTLRIQLSSLNPADFATINVCRKDIDLTCKCNKCDKTASQPCFGWANSIGHLIVDEYAFNMGNKCINRGTGEWLDWKSEFSQTSEKKAGYWEMVGKRDPPSFKPSSLSGPQDLLVPLELFFTGKPDHAFPSCAINEESQTISIKWRDFDDCWITSKSGTRPPITPQIRASLLVECVYLDDKERNRFLNQSHLYLIKQVQKTGPVYFNKQIKCPTVDMDVLHPVTSVYWAAKRTDTLQRSSSKDPDFTYGNDRFNYSCFRSRAKNTIQDPFKTCQLVLDGDPREPELPAKFYRLLQPHYRQIKTPSSYIYNYCFNLYQDDSQPNGSCNMSMINSKKLRCTMIDDYPVDYEIIMYCESYNFLIIKNRRIAVAFTV
jgi:hypothetical protein